MPVTAKLSRKFYDALGDEVANELVDWFNAVDLTYRTELREVNDLNWARFKAELNEAIAGLRGELKQEIGGLRSETKQEFASVRMEIEATGARLRTEMAVLRADLIKWMFLFWLGTIAVSIANRLF
jgi:hypothetical protein